MFKLWNFRFSNSFANKNLIWDWKLMKGITRVTSSFSVRIILLFKQIFSDGENSISIMLYSISHIVTYTSCSTDYLLYLLNQLNPPTKWQTLKENRKYFFYRFFFAWNYVHVAQPLSPRIAIDSYFWNPKKKENILIIRLTFEWYWP